jgi:hypothetical protein
MTIFYLPDATMLNRVRRPPSGPPETARPPAAPAGRQERLADAPCLFMEYGLAGPGHGRAGDPSYAAGGPEPVVPAWQMIPAIEPGSQNVER